MISAALRRSGGSLIITIPQSYAEQNKLGAGSRLALEILGSELKLRPLSPRKDLAELLAQTPEGLWRVPYWDEMDETGTER